MEHSQWTYLDMEGTQLFTMVLLPQKTGRFPVVIMRLPYVDYHENTPEEQVTAENLDRFLPFLKWGYAFVVQHCRGRGKSGGDFVPYVREREDGLHLQNWIRQQDFYNGELYLKGNSYMTSVHYVTAPFAPDIKGAIFGVQDCERYHICYHNGLFKTGLHGGWAPEQYLRRKYPKPNYTSESWLTLPLSEFSTRVYGEPSTYWDNLLKASDPADPFWNTRAGGAEARNALQHIRFPALLTTGFYDIYTGGIFAMWEQMDAEARSLSALVVSPNDHGDGYNKDSGICFPCGTRSERFGEDYEIDWLDHIRLGTPSPFEKGKITYYSLFENQWKVGFRQGTEKLHLPMGADTVSYCYDPTDAPGFPDGLSRAFGGVRFQEKPGSRPDVVTRYTAPFPEDTTVRGRMAARLTVASDCEDTCFLVRVSLETEAGDYGLRDDITTLCYALGDYTPGSKVTLDLRFDDHAFLIRKGQRLRIDVTSADKNHYLRHTNRKGPAWKQTTVKTACNTVYLAESILILPVAP